LAISGDLVSSLAGDHRADHVRQPARIPVFLPVAWVRANLPTHGASLLLTLLTPVLLIGGMVLWFTLYYAIYLDHYHLQNELGAFLVTLVPAVTALGGWIEDFSACSSRRRRLCSPTASRAYSITRLRHPVAPASARHPVPLG
jgi:hypothetical protein